MHNRAWVAKCSYRGKKQFYFGNVIIDIAAKEHEVLKEFHILWNNVSPYPFPDSYILIPGMLFLKEE